MPPLVLAAALVIHLALVSPWLGRRSYARLERERDRDGRILTRMFTAWTTELWALAAVALLVVGLSPEIDLAGVGFVLPADPGTTAGMLVGAAIGLAVAVLVAVRMNRAGRPVPGQAAFRAMLPRTPAERRGALVLSVSAGICEEIVYRGLLIALGTRVLGLPLPVAAGLALAVFVAGHLYQGWRGMAMVTLAGFGLTMLYLRTGSLLLPILLHAVVDIRSLLLVPAGKRDTLDGVATVRG
ncbi:CPBP family intramembrane glutamic endopeptidase [Streptosporangium sandarakinum]|uniref:Membrane protease YdiL (CAAX protease family) n=1 Tax=Streptosporangium sandarakinum TaxID=1260955 RepID=A0A852V155_9ACTN|nr:CPBP family intramembrane glutamic endopeptidase [Streptosporangium sandarakinum]NYF41398.1 membrane protease YdiL (CAAX protease family) [Streptosporangium sandarakinum]